MRQGRGIALVVTLIVAGVVNFRLHGVTSVACTVSPRPASHATTVGAHGALLRIDAGSVAREHGEITIHRVALDALTPAGATEDGRLHVEVTSGEQRATCQADGTHRVEVALRSNGATPVVRVASTTAIDLVLDSYGMVLDSYRFDRPADSVTLRW